MQYVGLDVHARQSTFCVLDEHGQKVLCRTVKGPWDKVLFSLTLVKAPFAICFEASTGYGYLYERLGKIADRVVVAHPGQLRLIFRAKRKNDRVDAEKLAKLLYLDEVPPVYVPSVDVRAWRGLIERRQRMLAERVRAKNALRAILRGQGIAAPKRLWTKRGMAWLRGVDLATRTDGLQRDVLADQVEMVTAMMRRLEAALEEIAQSHSGVQVLMDIPGVGLRTAEAVVAYVDDPARFAASKTVGSYFGLVPCQDSSAATNRLGHITRQGPATVRKLLTEAAWQGIRRSPTIRAYFLQVRHEDPERTRIAVVATAHYLLRVMLAMLKSGECWRETPAA